MKVVFGWDTGHLWLAKIAFHPELLTFSVKADSLAGLHDSTPLGDHRRTLLGVPGAAGPHAREPRPPAQLSTVLQMRRQRIGLVDRAFRVVLRGVWARWSDAVVIVKPETVIGWHRSGFALYWRWLSKQKRSPGRAAVGREVRDLVREDGARERMGRSADSRRVAEVGVHCLRAHRLALHAKHGRSPERRQSWLTFLRNHREVIVGRWAEAIP